MNKDVVEQLEERRSRLIIMAKKLSERIKEIREERKKKKK